MRVLGIDPGLGRTGYALVDGAPGRLRLIAADRVDTVPQTDDAARLLSLFRLIDDVVTAHRPEVVAVEQLFFSTNRRTAMRVGEARGVILCAVAHAGAPVAEYTPTQVKQAVCGYGGAGKPQVARMTRTLLGLETGRDDVADACAVAVCHHHRARLSALTKRRASRPAVSRLDIAIARARARVQVLGR
ncbi:MAG: crossover junction endodeoxyribonuclease RuvC [Candidatus Dormibacteraeota bacterium]|nr:crossover junction endodeoxyribonuclease RuvC [Candidatus Dormibacteraeota bacterium]